MLDERNVERAIRDYLRDHGWGDYWPEYGSTVDVCAKKTVDGFEFMLILEAKGDVGANVVNPQGQRLKYIQHALGQLIGRTGEKECGYGNSTVFGLAFPATCRNGTSYFRHTFQAKISPALRQVLRLCLFFVCEDGTVIADLPAGLHPALFV